MLRLFHFLFMILLLANSLLMASAYYNHHQFIRKESIETCGDNSGTTVTCDSETTTGCCLVNNSWTCCAVATFCDTSGGAGAHYCDIGSQCATDTTTRCYSSDNCCKGGAGSSSEYICCSSCNSNGVGCKEDKLKDNIILIITWLCVSIGICVFCCVCYGQHMGFACRHRYRKHPDDLDEHGRSNADRRKVSNSDDDQQNGPAGSHEYEDMPIQSMPISDFVHVALDYHPQHHHAAGDTTTTDEESQRSHQSQHSHGQQQQQKHHHGHNSSNEDVHSVHSNSNNNSTIYHTSTAPASSEDIPVDPYKHMHHYAHPRAGVHPYHRSNSPPTHGHAVEVQLGSHNDATVIYDRSDEEYLDANADEGSYRDHRAAPSKYREVPDHQHQKATHNLNHNPDGSWEIEDTEDRRAHNHVHVERSHL